MGTCVAGWKRDRPRLSARHADRVRRFADYCIGLLSAEAGYYEAADKMLYQQATDPNGDANFRRIAARDWMNVIVLATRRSSTARISVLAACSAFRT